MSQVHQPAPLHFYAGERALARIRDNGLNPGDVSMMPGAAGGPKALGLLGLDRVLFGDWLQRAPRKRSLIGSSIGSWRFAAACLPDPVAGLERLAELYTAQRFPKGVTAAQITRQCQQMLQDLIQGQEAQVLDQEGFRLNVMVNPSRGLAASDSKALLSLGLLGVVAANTLNRGFIRTGFERVVLHDAREKPPLGAFTDFSGRYAELTPQNLQDALLASASIPMVMEAVPEIAGVAGRQFRDGGLTDYHLDLPYESDGLVLYPHFTERVVPGWFDKTLPWRRGNTERLRDVVLLAPSPAYLAGLPDGRLPDRRDFKVYEGDDETREKHWRQAMAESRRLGDYFMERVESGRFVEEVRPLSELPS